MSDLQEFIDVPCPFCGLLCDDLRITVEAGAATVQANGCARSRRLFSGGAARSASPAIAGQRATLEQALAHATGILRHVKRPVNLLSWAFSAGTGSTNVHRTAVKNKIPTMFMDAST
ncbi:MAG: hypothetical protein ABI619_11330, partial [Betaproteobacteria bacterium]